MKRIYVAGKYSADNVMGVLGNIRRGIAICRELLIYGYAPFCPWLDHLYVVTADLSDLDQMTKETFQLASMAWVETCDALLVISGAKTSRGVISEVHRANDLGIPIFYNIADLREWTNK